MTREWFEDNINNFDELIQFCYDNECDILDGLHPESDIDEYICDDIRGESRRSYWTDIRDELNRIYEEQYGDYFFYRGTFDYVWISSDYDFEDYKARVIEWAEDVDFFEYDSEDEESEDGEFEEDSAPADDGFEAVDINQLLGWQ